MSTKLCWPNSGLHQDLECHATKNRDDRIRTCGPFVPNEVRYQAAPHPVGTNVEDRPPPISPIGTHWIHALLTRVVN